MFPLFQEALDSLTKKGFKLIKFSRRNGANQTNYWKEFGMFPQCFVEYEHVRKSRHKQVNNVRVESDNNKQG